MRRRRGQALVEYALVLAALVVLGGVGWPVLARLVRALDALVQALFFVVAAPLG